MVFDLVELWVPIWLRPQSATRPSIYLVLPVYDLRRSAAEDNAITHAAAAAKNMYAATPLQLQRLSSKAP